MSGQTENSFIPRQESDGAAQIKRSDVNGKFDQQLTAVADVIQRFELAPLVQTVRACEALSRDEPIDLAVLGQFKSGKSSLLNVVLDEAVLPVGALPVTAVVTRVVAGSERTVRVVYLDGNVEEIPTTRLAEFVTEASNPANRRKVAVIDVFTPAMRDLPEVRLVDTPGLGSVFAHNTEATHAWIPNAAAAIVTVSAERPLSESDLRLVDEARQTAPRVVVLLTKVDLLTDAEREQVIVFLESTLNEKFDTRIPVLPFSARVDTKRWLQQLRENLLLPVAGNVAGERREALALKLNVAIRACHDYLSVGLQAAERTDADREQLRAAVFNEKSSVAVIQDELGLAEHAARASARLAFQEYFLHRQLEMAARVNKSLSAELSSWQGNLAKQARRYEVWMKAHLNAEMTPLSTQAVSLANGLIDKAENRYRRIVEAFRDRLNGRIREATGITVSPVAWEASRPELKDIPVNLGQTFMIHWDLLWWMLPMNIFGGAFRKHALAKVAWEVEKNLTRLVNEWTMALERPVANLRVHAMAWVEAELNTLDRLLSQQPAASAEFREALRRIDGIDMPSL